MLRHVKAKMNRLPCETDESRLHLPGAETERGQKQGGAFGTHGERTRSSETRCIMGQAVCRRACTQHAGSMQQAVKNAACCIYAKCLVLARCIFHSMHSAFSQHAAHCVLSSRISHCYHPFAGPIRSSAPSRQVAPSSEKCGILHVASSKQQAAKSAA